MATIFSGFELGEVDSDEYATGGRAFVPPPLDSLPAAGEAFSSQNVPTTQDWEAHREIITQLYKTERRPLKEIKAAMERQYGFKATERMYKKRFRDWNIGKNLRKSERDALCHALRLRESSGKTEHEIVVRGQRISVDRIYRYMQQHGDLPIRSANETPPDHHERDDIVVRSPGSPSTLADNLVELRYCTICGTSTRQPTDMICSPRLSRPILRTQGDQGRIETICQQSVLLFEVSDFHLNSQNLDISSPCIRAVSMAQKGRYQDVRFSLNEASERIKSGLRAGSPVVLPVFINALALMQYFKLDEKILQSFHTHALQLSHIILGPYHPTTVVVKQMRSVEDSLNACCWVHEAIITFIESMVYPRGCQSSFHFLIDTLCLSLRLLGENARAIGWYERALQSCDDSVNGVKKAVEYRYRIAILRILCYDDLDRSELLFRSLLNEALDISTRMIELQRFQYSLEGFALVAEKRGNMAKAEIIHRISYAIALERNKGIDKISMTRILLVFVVPENSKVEEFEIPEKLILHLQFNEKCRSGERSCDGTWFYMDIDFHVPPRREPDLNAPEEHPAAGFYAETNLTFIEARVGSALS